MATVTRYSERPYTDQRERLRLARSLVRHGYIEYRCPECSHLLCKVDAAECVEMPATARAWCCKWWNVFRD